MTLYCRTAQVLEIDDQTFGNFRDIRVLTPVNLLNISFLLLASFSVGPENGVSKFLRNVSKHLRQ